MHEIRIQELEVGGFSVMVGCQSFFYITKDAMLSEVNTYLEDRRKAETRYNAYKQHTNRDRYYPTPEAPTGAGPTVERVRPGLADQEPVDQGGQEQQRQREEVT